MTAAPCLTCIFWERNKQDGIIGECGNAPASFHDLPEYRFQFERCARHMGDCTRAPHSDIARATGLCAELRKARINMGLSQDDAALWFGMSKRIISLWECGKVEPAPANIERINKFIQLVNLPLFTE